MTSESPQWKLLNYVKLMLILMINLHWDTSRKIGDGVFLSISLIQLQHPLRASAGPAKNGDSADSTNFLDPKMPQKDHVFFSNMATVAGICSEISFAKIIERSMADAKTAHVENYRRVNQKQLVVTIANVRISLNYLN
jgi:hypothetical protein